MLADPAGATSIRIGIPEDLMSRPMAAVFAGFAARHREIRLDVVAGLSRDLTRRYRAGDFDIVIVKEAVADADCRASHPEPMGWFEAAGAPARPDPLPLVSFPPGGLYREAMFERIEREGRSWYVAFSGSSLHNVLVAVEAGLGLTLVPVASTSGYGVRPFAPFGTEAAMVVSVYAWETAGPAGDLVQGMNAALLDRLGRLSGER